MRTLFIALLVASSILLTRSCASPGGEEKARRPNVVYVLADDLGYAEVGCYGQEKIATPHIDQLASGGMRFTQHYSGSPVCAPARCVLLTGLHTGHSIVRANSERGGWGPDEPEGQFPLPEGTETLGSLLSSAGYRTAAVGKWGLGGPDSTGQPNRQGFDLFYGYLCQRVAHNFYPTHLWRNESKAMLEGNEYFSSHQRIDAPLATEEEYWERYTEEQYAPDSMIEEALGFIRESGDDPFFLYFASTVPHAAIQVPPEELDAYPAEWDEEHYLGQKGYLPHPSPRRGYAAMVTRFDRDIGRILSLLDELDLSDDTIVMFSSDNGPTFNGGSDSTFFESTGGLRGLKTKLYEGGIRVPFIVRWPGKVAPSTTTDLVSGFQDVLPTVLDLAGVGPGRSAIDGISLAPTILSNGEQVPREFMYWEYKNQQALRMGDWKGIRPNLTKRGLETELYDLAADPNETTNLAAEQPEILASIEAHMAEARTPSEAFPLKTFD
jgi:arylsulfatase A